MKRRISPLQLTHTTRKYPREKKRKKKDLEKRISFSLIRRRPKGKRGGGKNKRKSLVWEPSQGPIVINCCFFEEHREWGEKKDTHKKNRKSRQRRRAESLLSPLSP
jgi:hypothetical protein